MAWDKTLIWSALISSDLQIFLPTLCVAHLPILRGSDTLLTPPERLSDLCNNNPKARELQHLEDERRGFRGSGSAARETIYGILAERLGLYPPSPEPPPGFLARPEVDLEGEELFDPLNNSEKTYLEEATRHQEGLRQYVTDLLRRL